MSVVRSPTGSGMTAGHSSSQPNLVSEDVQLKFTDSDRATLRNKRKQTEDRHIHDELSEIRNQLSRMMELMTTLTSNQKEFMEKISGDILLIKEEINDIKNVTNKLTIEQNSVRNDVLNLKDNITDTGKRIDSLVSDFEQLKDTVSTPSVASTLELMMTEIREREERSKNIIMIGVPEMINDNREDGKNSEKYEVLRLTRVIHAECPEPTYITRLGKYTPNRNRPIKVCYASQETVKNLLRQRNNLKSEIRVFSDQTPQQQTYMKTLKDQLKRRIDDGDKDLTIKYIKGVPRIVKLPSKN